MVIDMSKPEALAEYFSNIPNKTVHDMRNNMFINGVLNREKRAGKNGMPSEVTPLTPEEKSKVILTYMINDLFRVPETAAVDWAATGTADEFNKALFRVFPEPEQREAVSESLVSLKKPRSPYAQYSPQSNQLYQREAGDKSDPPKIYSDTGIGNKLYEMLAGGSIPDNPAEWKNFLRGKLQEIYPQVKASKTKERRVDAGKQHKGNFKPATERTPEYEAYKARVADAKYWYDRSLKGDDLTDEQSAKADWYEDLFGRASEHEHKFLTKVRDDLVEKYTVSKGEAKRQYAGAFGYVQKLLQDLNSSDDYVRRVENRIDRDAAKKYGRAEWKLPTPDYVEIRAEDKGFSPEETLEKFESAMNMLAAKTGKDYSKDIKRVEEKLTKQAADTYLGGIADNIMTAELDSGIGRRKSDAERLGFDSLRDDELDNY